MKHKLLALALCCLIGSTLADVADPVSQAERLFENHGYTAGFQLLSEAMLDETLTVEQRCDIAGAAALFHEELTGNYQQALRCHRLILRADLLPANPAKTSARTNLMRIESLGRKYAPQNTLLDDLTANPEKIPQHLAQLQSIPAEHPAYYRLAEVHYCVAAGFAKLEQYDQAAQSIAASLDLKPALGAWLPIQDHLEPCRRYAQTVFIDRCSYAVVAAYLGVLLLGLLFFRPWRWEKPARWIAVTALLIIVSGIFFATMMKFDSQIEDLRPRRTTTARNIT